MGFLSSIKGAAKSVGSAAKSVGRAVDPTARSSPLGSAVRAVGRQVDVTDPRRIASKVAPLAVKVGGYVPIVGSTIEKYGNTALGAAKAVATVKNKGWQAGAQSVADSAMGVAQASGNSMAINALAQVSSVRAAIADAGGAAKAALGATIARPEEAPRDPTLPSNTLAAPIPTLASGGGAAPATVAHAVAVPGVTFGGWLKSFAGMR